MKGFRKPADHPGGNYLPALAVLAGQIRAGDVVAVQVLHEEHCALLRGKGPCNCEPVVAPMPVDEAGGANP